MAGYAFVAARNTDALTIVDVSKPGELVIAGTISGASLRGATDVVVRDNYAYIAWQDGVGGLTIVDISDPADPVIVGSINNNDVPGFLDNAIRVFVLGDHAYVTTDAFGAYGLTIIDISNPAAPVYKGSIQGEGAPNYLRSPLGLYVVGNYAYIAASTDDCLTIIDVSNPASPAFAARFNDVPPWPLNLDQLSDVFVRGNYAYAVSDNDSALTIIDVSNPLAPTFVGDVVVGDRLEHLYVAGNYAYATARDNDVLFIIDVSNPAAPVVVGRFSLNTAEPFFETPRGVFVVGGYAYIVSSDSDGLCVINVSNPSNPTLAGKITSPLLDAAMGVILFPVNTARYRMNLRDLHFLYEDLDKKKQLHMTLVNLSPTTKRAGSRGQAIVEVGYEPTA